MRLHKNTKLKIIFFSNKSIKPNVHVAPEEGKEDMSTHSGTQKPTKTNRRDDSTRTNGGRDRGTTAPSYKPKVGE